MGFLKWQSSYLAEARTGEHMHGVRIDSRIDQESPRFCMAAIAIFVSGIERLNYNSNREIENIYKLPSTKLTLCEFYIRNRNKNQISFTNKTDSAARLEI